MRALEILLRESQLRKAGGWGEGVNQRMKIWETRWDPSVARHAFPEYKEISRLLQDDNGIWYSSRGNEAASFERISIS
jgi:alkyl sulfatase BDS1-like metallo-beta-lactamase superfamily hydrolase